MTVVSLPVFAQTDSLEEAKQEVYQYYINLCQDMNKQLPAQVDEITTLYSLTFSGWAFCAKYKLSLYLSDLTDDDISELKYASYEGMKKFARRMLESGAYGISRSDYRMLMKAIGLKYIRTYSDLDGNFLFALSFDYHDF